MTEVGDKGIVFAAGSEYSQFTPANPPIVGDKVILYNLGNGQRLAVPTLAFGLDSFTFVCPSFQFAGFDWKLDWNFQLIPLNFYTRNLNQLLADEFWDALVPDGTVLWSGTVEWDGISAIYIGGSEAGDSVPGPGDPRTEGNYPFFIARYGTATASPHYLVIDDGLEIRTTKGAITFDDWGFMPPQNITTILNPGINNVTIKIITDDLWDGHGQIYLWTGI
jgi:hypothetical protein